VSGSGRDEELDAELSERYRQASAAEAGRPSPAVRNAILANAQTVARRNSGAATEQVTAMGSRRAANDPVWRMKAVAVIAVACIATLVAVRIHETPVQQLQPSSPEGSREFDTSGRAPPAPQELPPPPAQTAVVPSPAPLRQLPESRLAAGKPAQIAPAAGSAVAKAPRSTAEPALGQAELASAPVAANQASNASSVARADAVSADVGAMRNSQRVAPRAAGAPPQSVAESLAPEGSLVDAAAAGDAARVDRLLRAGASTEQADAQGRTALMVATLSGRTDIVRRLLDAGANINAMARDGDTPLAAAQRQGTPAILDMLQNAAGQR